MSNISFFRQGTEEDDSHLGGWRNSVRAQPSSTFDAFQAAPGPNGRASNASPMLFAPSNDEDDDNGRSERNHRRVVFDTREDFPTQRARVMSLSQLSQAANAVSLEQSQKAQRQQKSPSPPLRHPSPIRGYTSVAILGGDTQQHKWDSTVSSKAAAKKKKKNKRPSAAARFWASMPAWLGGTSAKKTSSNEKDLEDGSGTGAGTKPKTTPPPSFRNTNHMVAAAAAAPVLVAGTGLAPIFVKHSAHVTHGTGGDDAANIGSGIETTRYLPESHERIGLLAPRRPPTNRAVARAIFISRVFLLLTLQAGFVLGMVTLDAHYTAPWSVVSSCCFFSIIFIILSMVCAFHFRREYPINYLCILGYNFFCTPFIVAISRLVGTYFATIGVACTLCAFVVLFLLYTCMPHRAGGSKRRIVLVAAYVASTVASLYIMKWWTSGAELEAIDAHAHEHSIEDLRRLLRHVWNEHGEPLARYTALYCSFVVVFFCFESATHSVDYYHCYDYVVGYIEASMFAPFIVVNRHGTTKIIGILLLLCATLALFGHTMNGGMRGGYNNGGNVHILNALQTALGTPSGGT